MKNLVSVSAVLLLSVGAASAASNPGGGPVETDCHLEFFSSTSRLNFPPYDPADPQPPEETRCFDGDPVCDIDGVVNGVCQFEVGYCLRNTDLPACSPEDVVAAEANDPDLQGALEDLLPATSTVCTEAAIHEVRAEGDVGLDTIRTEVTTASGAVDSDEFRFGCVPHGWPAHGYNWGNHRSTSVETKIRPDNAGALTVKWQVAVDQLRSGPPPVTATPVVGHGMVYVTSWNGSLFALDAEDGRVVWIYDSGSVFLGLEGSATLTGDGRILVGADREVHCLSAFDGSLLWSTEVSASPFSEIWGGPTVANGRVFVGVASMTDIPCADDGKIAALDLDSGEILWDYVTTPDKVCSTDTATECDVNEDCPLDGECVVGRGAGITATPAVSRDGEIVYVNTVGCFTFPSIGDSDSMMAFAAATGQLLWKNRVQPPEQFGACAEDGSIECATDEECGAGGCQTKGAYHDFGFLNGPMVIEVPGADGPQTLIVSGSKDGTLYAFDPASGEIVWTNEIVPAPVTPGFAGWGLFNGAIGFADGIIYGALHDVAARTPPFDQLQAFDAGDGSQVWSDPFRRSWSDVTVANGVLFTGDCGTNTTCGGSSVACPEGEDCPAGHYYVYNAQTGEQIKAFETLAPVPGGAAIVDGVVYMPYGLFTDEGGIVAFEVACPGDCNLDQRTEVAELVRGIDVSLGGDGLGCDVFDRNGDGVTINELVLAVRASLLGCEETGI